MENVEGLARQRLEEAVARGRANAGPVIARVLQQVPVDTLIRPRAAVVTVNDDGSVRLNGTDTAWQLHHHAERQMFDRLRVPAQFVDMQREPIEIRHGTGRSARVETRLEPWRLALLQHVLREVATHSEQRWLVRAVEQDGVLQARAVLSDAYRRIDARPMLDAFADGMNRLGAVPYDGTASDLRASVKYILPRIYEPVPNEHMVFGLSWTNSDFGAGTYVIAFFILRLLCRNGMVGASELRQVHLGGRLPENYELSERTLRLDTETMISATRDVVRGALGPGSVQQNLDRIRAAADPNQDLRAQWATIAKQLGKADAETVRKAFDGPDEINLPPGKSAWRLSNALSWLANQEDTAPEKQLDLQELAGRVLARAA